MKKITGGTAPAILWKDFIQTFVKGALSGYLIGCTAAIALAILVERFDFLRRGLLPVGNFLAAHKNPMDIRCYLNSVLLAKPRVRK